MHKTHILYIYIVVFIYNEDESYIFFIRFPLNRFTVNYDCGPSTVVPPKNNSI